MISPLAEREPGIPQIKPLRELTQSDLDTIVDVTGARVVVNVLPLEGNHLRRVSLIHFGNLISIDTQDSRHPGSDGPFLSIVSDGATQEEIPALSNPSVTITPDMITFTETIRGKDSRVLSRFVGVTKSGLSCNSSSTTVFR